MRTATKPKRDWRLHCSAHTQNCNQCGRAIVPWADCYFDVVSGHLVRHVACHEKAEAKA